MNRVCVAWAGALCAIVIVALAGAMSFVSADPASALTGSIPSSLPADGTVVPADAATQPAIADPVAEVTRLMDEMQLSMAEGVQDPRLDTDPSLKKSTSSITGQVITEDGSAPEGEMYMFVIMDAEIGAIFKVTDGSFAVSTKPGNVWLCVMTGSYGRKAFGPWHVEADKPVDDVTIVLSRGVSHQVHVTDPAGNPLSNVAVSARINVGPTRIGLSSEPTDANGMTTLDNLLSDMNDLEVRCPFYYRWAGSLNATEDKPTEVMLVPIPSVSGQVISKADGTPIPQAQVFVSSTGGYPVSPRILSGQVPTPDAVTDAQGRFVVRIPTEDDQDLTVVSRDNRYLSVHAEHGQSLKIELPEPLYVHGHFTGDLSKLPQDPAGIRKYSWQNIFRTLHSISTEGLANFEGQVRMVDGRAEFDLPLLQPGVLRIIAGKCIVGVNLSKSVTDLQINLDNPADPLGGKLPDGMTLLDPTAMNLYQTYLGPPVEEDDQSPKRKIVLKFVPPPGAAQAKGVVDITKPSTVSARQDLEILDNHVSFEASVGSKISVTLDHLVGAIAPKFDLVVPPGSEPLTREIHLIPTGAIRFTSVDDAGEPVSQRDFYADLQQPPAEWSGFSASMVAGRGPTPCQYMVRNLPLGVPVIISTPRNEGRAAASSEPVILTADHPVKDVTLVVPRGQTFKVHVQDLDRKAVAGQGVYLLWNRSGNLVSMSELVQSDAKGDILLDRVNLAAGKGWSVRLKGPPGIQWTSLPLEDGKNQLTIQYAKGLHAHGRVVDGRTGRPVINFPLYASRWGGFRSRGMIDVVTYTDDHGLYEFDSLGPEDYQLNSLRTIFSDSPPPAGTDPEKAELPRIRGGQQDEIPLEIYWMRELPIPYQLGEISPSPAGMPPAAQ